MKRSDSLLSRFGTYTNYDNMQFVVNALTDNLNVFTRFKRNLDEHSDFLDVKVPNDTFFLHAKMVIQQFLPLADAHSLVSVQEALLVVLEFITP